MAESNEAQPQNNIRVVWGDNGERFLRNISNYIHNKLYSDCTLLIGREKYPIKCHRLILAASSKWFETVLKCQPYSTATIYLPAVTRNEILPLLELIYNGEMETHTGKDMWSVMNGLKFLGVKAFLPPEPGDPGCPENVRLSVYHRNAPHSRFPPDPRPLPRFRPRPRNHRLYLLGGRCGYSREDLAMAAMRIINGEMTLLNAARYYGVPSGTLLEYVRSERVSGRR